MNQHSYPWWGDLDNRMMLRLPDWIKAGVEFYAPRDRCTQAEWIRRALADEIARRDAAEFPSTQAKARTSP